MPPQSFKVIFFMPRHERTKTATLNADSPSQAVIKAIAHVKSKNPGERWLVRDVCRVAEEIPTLTDAVAFR